MALNLWKVGGKSTSFNPLPATYTYGTSLNSLALPPAINNSNSNAVLSFWAYSPSSGIVHLNSTNVAKDFNLTPTRQFYSYILSDSRAYNHIDLYDKNSNGDIIIDSISLVQAPLLKNTINGVDGFLSGKWGYGGSSTTPATLNIIDDTTATLVSTDTSWKNAYIIVPVQPNTTYTFSGQFSSNFTTAIALRIDSVATATSSGGGSIIYNGTVYFNSPSCTFTTPNNSNGFIMIYFQTHYVENLTWKNVILNTGSLPAPYEPKHGDKMVMPVVSSKNLAPFDIGTFTKLSGETITRTPSYIEINAPSGGTGYGCQLDQIINVAPNTNYTISGSFSLISGQSSAGQGFRVHLIDTNSYSSMSTTSVTFNSGSNSRIQLLFYAGLPVSVQTVVRFYFGTVQLEQGIVSTPYTQYAMQTNPKSNRLVPDKNIFAIYDVARVNCPTISSTYPTDTIGINGFSNGLHFPNNSSTYYAYQSQSVLMFSATSVYTVSFYVSMDDGSMPSVSNSNSSGDFSIVVNSGLGVTTNLVTQQINTTIYRVSGTINSLNNVGNIGIAKYNTQSSKGFTVSGWQLELGTSPTTYEPYKLVNPPSNSGLSFNGTTDYVDLGTFLKPVNSLSIESVFRVNSAFSSVEKSIVRKDQCFELGLYNNGTNYYIRNIVKTSSVSGWTAVNDIPFALVIGQWYKLKMVFNNDGNIYTYLNDSLIATKPATGSYVDTPSNTTRIASGINMPSPFLNCDIQYVNFIVDGISFNYDFTSAYTITGTTALTGGNTNLIPSFDNPSWTIHPNAKVLGNDVLHLDATAGSQSSFINIPVITGASYMALYKTGFDLGHRMYLYHKDGVTAYGGMSPTSPPMIITTVDDTIKVALFNYPTVSGSFDFFRPQLYQLTGKEGTINGTPKQLNKQTKRTLYAKR